MSAPCTFLCHKWGVWYPLKVTLIGRDEMVAGRYDTQERACERCGREQRKRWWNR